MSIYNNYDKKNYPIQLVHLEEGGEFIGLPPLLTQTLESYYTKHQIEESPETVLRDIVTIYNLNNPGSNYLTMSMPENDDWEKCKEQNM